MTTIMASRSVPMNPQPSLTTSTIQSHPFTCNTCQVAFRSSELQRGHMRNDWHRYNLKRRVASLPPLSSEYFTEKVLTAQATSSAAAAKASFEKNCSACQKTYYSENAYQNHLKSQKHRLRIAILQSGEQASQDDVTSLMSCSTFTLGEPFDVPSKDAVNTDAEVKAALLEVAGGSNESVVKGPETDSSHPSKPDHSATQPPASNENRTKVPQQNSISAETKLQTEKLEVPLNRCMFCNYESPTFKLGIMHMHKFHGMFIPEQQYLIDPEGLIRYLFTKIIQNHECLHCHRVKGSTSSVQTHMRDTGHCMIAFETEEEMVEVGQFYDFSSTYSDEEEDDANDELEHTNDDATGGVSLTSKHSKALKTVTFTPNGDEEVQDEKLDNEGWETDSSASSLDSDEISAIPVDRAYAFEKADLHSHHSHTGSRSNRSSDGTHAHAHSHRAVFRSDYELYLPSGRTAGHRSLARYFRQNLHSYPAPTERLANRLIEEASPPIPSGDSRGRELTSRADGGLGMVGVTEAKKQEVRAIEKRERKREQRAQDQYQWGVDKRGNSQKHFRDPLLQ